MSWSFLTLHAAILIFSLPHMRKWYCCKLWLVLTLRYAQYEEVKHTRWQVPLVTVHYQWFVMLLYSTWHTYSPSSSPTWETGIVFVGTIQCMPQSLDTFFAAPVRSGWSRVDGDPCKLTAARNAIDAHALRKVRSGIVAYTVTYAHCEEVMDTH